MKKIGLIGLVAFVLPVIASAQLGNLTGLVASIGNIIRLLIPIVFALALLVFFWGLVTYIFAADHDKEKAKKTMLWGVVALFVMAAVWGLVGFIGDALGVNNDAAPQVNPLIPR